jgi:hypothetical protein
VGLFGAGRRGHGGGAVRAGRTESDPADQGGGPRVTGGGVRAPVSRC